MNGFEVCREIRKSFHLSDLPIIILTARSEQGAIVEAYAAGANDYMVKPFAREELLARIRTHLQVKDSIRKLKEIQAEVVRAGQLASLGELAAGVAHEVTTPINAIINCAQILMDGASSGKIDPQFAKLIVKEGKRIDSIVKSLLKFGRAAKKEKTACRISDVLQEAFALSGTQLRKENIASTVDCPDDLPLCSMNFQEIQQVFLNLISNSRYALMEKYGPGAHSEKKITITVGSRSTPHPSIKCEFHDCGCGIPVEQLARIGVPFFTTKPEGKGTGLGMSICHGIIADHGGTMTIESEEQHYTLVAITLPIGGSKEL